MKESLGIFTMSVLGGLIGLKIIGPSFVIMFFFLYVSLMLVDMFMGYYIARKEKRVNSLSMIDWMIRKSIIVIIVWLISILFWHVAYIFKENDFVLYTGLIPMIILFWFILAEVVSILENYLKLDWNKKEEKVVKVLLSILWIWFHKWLDFMEDKGKTIINDLFDKKK